MKTLAKHFVLTVGP